MGAALSSQRYRSRRPPQEALRQRLREMAIERVRWDYRRLHILLKRKGVQVSHHAQATLEVRTWPAPVCQELHLEYRLTRPGPVVVTICDLQGRNRFRRDLGWRSPGRGELRLGPEVLGQLTPGCYYLRFESAALTVAKRLIVVP